VEFILSIAEGLLAMTGEKTFYDFVKVTSMRRPPASSETRDGGQAPGVLHHVMGRGIEGRNIFLNTPDRNDCIARLRQPADNRSMAVYAWALVRGSF